MTRLFDMRQFNPSGIIREVVDDVERHCFSMRVDMGETVAFIHVVVVRDFAMRDQTLICCQLNCIQTIH